MPHTLDDERREFLDQISKNAVTGALMVQQISGPSYLFTAMIAVLIEEDWNDKFSGKPELLGLDARDIVRAIALGTRVAIIPEEMAFNDLHCVICPLAAIEMMAVEIFKAMNTVPKNFVRPTSATLIIETILCPEDHAMADLHRLGYELTRCASILDPR